MELLNLSFNLVNKITDKNVCQKGFVHDSECETHTHTHTHLKKHFDVKQLRKRSILFKYYISINISQEKA